jgi:hypothetical protein
MARKQSSWISQFERKVAYDRDTFITICQRYIRGEELSAICAKAPMPAAQCFLSQVQNNEEARAIWECALKFKSDRGLAKELNVPMDYGLKDWSNAVYDKLEHGYSLSNYLDQQYIMPDWKKLYPLVGEPPVWSSENLSDYEYVLKEVTQLLKPRDFMECVYTKEMADGIWEDKREGREKNSVPERQYQVRLSEAHALRVREACQRNLPMPKPAQEPATALDYIRGFRTGFKTYQALDRAQERKKKRRDNAPRRIASWRKSFGGKAEALPDKFIAELALAKRDGVAQFASDTQTDHILHEPMQADPSPVPAGESVQADPSPPPGCEAVNGSRPVANTEEVTQATASVDHKEEVTQAATLVASADTIAQSMPAADPANAAEPASLVAETGEPELAPTNHAPQAVPSPAAAEKVAEAAAAAPGANAQAAPPIPPAQAADAAPPRTPVDEVEVEVGGVRERINWVAWLTGAKRHHWDWLSKAAQKAFQRPFMSKGALVRHLVLERKIVRPDQVCRLLEPWLRASDFPPLPGAGTNAASSIGASGETPEAASGPPPAQADSRVGLACS